MIYKSFWRKKTTIIYFIICTLLVFILGLLEVSKNSYIERENYYHRRSYILISNLTENILDNVDNVSDIEKVIKQNIDGVPYTLFQKEDLSKDGVIVSLKSSDSINIGDLVEINCENRNFTLKVDGFSDNLSSFSIMISKELFEELDAINASNLYLVKLKNWIKYEETLDIITNDLKLDATFHNGTLNNEEDYKDIFNVINVFLSLFVIGFIVTFTITILNIISDEKNNNYLYKVLGYSKTKRFIIMFVKVMMVLLSSVVINMFIFGLYFFIIK